MTQDHEQSPASPSPSAAAARRNDALEPGQASRSAQLRKRDEAVPSGLVKPFTPPKLGVATTTVVLRGKPKTGPDSAKLGNITRNSMMTVRSEVQSTDRAYPQWFEVEVEVGKRVGFVAAQFVAAKDDSKEPEGEKKPEAAAPSKEKQEVPKRGDVIDKAKDGTSERSLHKTKQKGALIDAILPKK